MMDTDPMDYRYGELDIEFSIGLQGHYAVEFEDVCHECARKIQNIDTDDFKEFFVEKFMGVTSSAEWDAEWKYWEGWMSNHDKRIEDATCSNCGYRHPTIRFGNPDLLQDYCPSCKSKMKKQ